MDLKLPIDFITRMRKQLGGEADDFFAALSQPAPVSIRFNPFKPMENGEWRMDSGMQNNKKTFSTLNSQFSTSSIPWCDDGFYVNERPAFIYDPLFHAGCYYVQEASSMFVGRVAKQLLRDTTNPILLDAAAAPGGKSTHLLSVLNRKGFLVTNEVISQRNSILQENIWKWGVSNQAITQQQLSEFGQTGEFFDLILLDAPCSGEGLFRRDPEACNEWSLQSVNGCSIRQRQLITDVLPALKIDGYLIYSTCTYADEENDDNVETALQNYPVEKVDIEVPEGVVKTKHGYQFYPHLIKGEGFYISVLQKTGTIESSSTKAFRNTSDTKHKAHDDAFTKDYVLKTTDYFNHNLGNITYAIPNHAETFIDQLLQFNLKSIGTPLYENVNNRGVPHSALALHSDYLTHQAVELDENTALQYLYGDALTNDTDVKQGYAVAQYQQKNLGWMKAAPNRFNNLYPHHWRIRKRKT